MKIPDRHFFRFAGAEPAKQMFKQQLKAEKAYVATLTYEKSPDDPDRPDNIEKAAASRPVPAADDPSKILGGLRESKPPSREAPEPGSALNLPADQRRASAPERDSGRVVQETA